MIVPLYSNLGKKSKTVSKKKKEKRLPNTSYKTRIILIPKSDRHCKKTIYE